jgi:Flp pilus assembly protein TadG
MMSIVARSRARSDDEGGAVAVFVALCLIVIMAMAVLTVDVGGLLYKRRAMVNAADAAALAAAQSCALTTDTTNPEAEADANAMLNVGGLQATDGGIIDSVGCDTNHKGHVTVRYTTTQPLFFAQVLGFGTQQNVQTAATAAWGAAGGPGSPVPVVLNLATFQGNCAIPLPDTAIGQQCYLWYDNDTFNGANFGFLDLSEWGVDPTTTNCNSGGGSTQLDSWIAGVYTGPTLSLNYPDPTYVCSTSGNRSSTWSALSNYIGQIETFPINDQTKQIVGSGGQTTFFDLVGFASLRIENIYAANQAPPACGPPPGNSSAHCIIVSWQGYQLGGVDPNGGRDFGTTAIRLCDQAVSPCPDQ